MRPDWMDSDMKKGGATVQHGTRPLRGFADGVAFDSSNYADNSISPQGYWGRQQMANAASVSAPPQEQPDPSERTTALSPRASVTEASPGSYGPTNEMDAYSTPVTASKADDKKASKKAAPKISVPTIAGPGRAQQTHPDITASASNTPITVKSQPLVEPVLSPTEQTDRYGGKGITDQGVTDAILNAFSLPSSQRSKGYTK